MKDIGKMMLGRGKGGSFGTRISCMKGSGKTERNQVKANTITKMETNMKDSCRRERGMGSEPCSMPTGKSPLASGTMISL